MWRKFSHYKQLLEICLWVAIAASWSFFWKSCGCFCP